MGFSRQESWSWLPFPSLEMLSCSHSLFRRLLKGKLGKRSGHLLILTLHFYFFNLQKEAVGQAKHCMIKRSERCAWAGNEQGRAREVGAGVPGSRLRTEWKRPPPESTSCQRLLPVTLSELTMLLGEPQHQAPVDPKRLLPMKTPPSES